MASSCGQCCWTLTCILAFLIFFGGIIAVIVLSALGVIGGLTIKYNIVNSSLTEFNLMNNNSQLHYNLVLNITLLNPSRTRVYYRRIEFQAYYKDKHFDTTTMGTFSQHSKKTNMLSPVFQGQSPILLGGSELSDFMTERSNGTFHIDVKLYLRYQVYNTEGGVWKYKQKNECGLRIPLQSKATSVGTFGILYCKGS